MTERAQAADAVNRVLIVGYGEMGHAMQHLLQARNRVQVWNRHPQAGTLTIPLEQAVAEADTVVFCVPVSPLAELAARVLPALPRAALSLSVAKGLDEQGRPAPQILSDVYAGRREFAVLYGPMIAEEIVAGRLAYADAGVSRRPEYARVAALFTGSRLSLAYLEDLQGMAWSSVLKNVYAMLFGAADSLQLGDNVRGYLVVAALAEMQSIVRSMGGQAATVQQLAGLGDLVTTATSAGSHHHALGGRLVRGESGLKGEGIHTLSMVRRFGLIDETRYPLFALTRQLVDLPDAGAATLRDYLQNPPPS